MGKVAAGRAKTVRINLRLFVGHWGTLKLRVRRSPDREFDPGIRTRRPASTVSDGPCREVCTNGKHGNSFLKSPSCFVVCPNPNEVASHGLPRLQRLIRSQFRTKTDGHPNSIW
jgi:hypothetical protein